MNHFGYRGTLAKLVQGTKRAGFVIVLCGLLIGAVARAEPLTMRHVDIVNPCKDRRQRDGDCVRALARTTAKLKALKKNPSPSTVRMVMLGDSHIAADYITGPIRDRLQDRFGDAGRGFTHADQPWGFGGRRARAGFSGWKRLRIVDRPELGGPYGFSGFALESEKKGAKVNYVLGEKETRVRIFFEKHAKSSAFEVRADGVVLERIDARSKERTGTAQEIAVPPRKKPAKKKERFLEIVALGPGVWIQGISFETGKGGVFFDSIGPVGADAKVYLQIDRRSFREQLAALSPDLVVLMVGGNDAMKIRKGWTDLARVTNDHRQLIDLLREAAPAAECLIWSPMDAGQKSGGKVVGKAMIDEVRAMQRAVAEEKGCAFWDLLESMGGPGSIGRWSASGLINKDLVHPRKRGADLIGRGFSEAFLSGDGLDDGPDR